MPGFRFVGAFILRVMGYARDSDGDSMAEMSPRGNLLAGVALLAVAVMETLTGESLGGHGQAADRADNPRNYWGNVAIAYAASLFFIGRYLYQVISN